MQGYSLAAACRLAVVPDSRIYGPEHHLIGRGIVNAACNRPAIFDESDGNTEFRNPRDEFPSTVEWIHDPHTIFAEPGLIIHTLFGEPSLTFAQQVSTQHFVDGAIGLSHRIVTDLVFRFDFAQAKTAEDYAGSIQRGLNALKNVGVSR